MPLLLLLAFAFVDLAEGWQYALTAPRATPPVDVVWTEEPVEPRERELWYRVPVPPALPEDPQLVFRSYVAAFDVFVDERRVYSFREDAAAGRMRLHAVALGGPGRLAAGGTAGRVPARHYLYFRVPRGTTLPLLGGTPTIAARSDVPRALIHLTTAPLHGDIEDVILGAILIVIGIASAAVSRVRRGANTSALLWFGVFAALYGLRLIVDSYLLLLLGATPRQSEYAGAWITSVISVPGWLMARSLLGDGWRGMLRWQVWAFALFAPIAIVAGIVTGDPSVLEWANNVLVVLGGLNILLNLILTRKQHTRELRMVLIGSTVFMLFALMNNLSALTGRSVDETPGFIVFVACLGYASTRVFMRGERDRVALEGELATARDIQLGILPTSMPSVTGLRFAARYAPASTVAGDFYDFVAADATRVGVIVADVAGHGVPA
ncbi:MAG TPA: hypothetical protein VF883_09115, partial [Thermoanaerobaculia bacterium]